jgi:trimeric autotransporter adhesin
VPIAAISVRLIFIFMKKEDLKVKKKILCVVSFFTVFAIIQMGFSVAARSVSGADRALEESPPALEHRVSPTEDDHGETGTEGDENTFYGDLAGSGNSGKWVTFIGAEAGAGADAGGNSGDSNTFVGQRCGWKNTSGASNTFAGRNAGAFNTGGNDNTFVGRAAGYGNTTGQHNSFIGSYAGFSIKTHRDNTFVGYAAGEKNDASFNTFIGSEAGYDCQEGYGNVFIGCRAGSEATGSNNVFIGYSAGRYETGSGKLYIHNDYVGDYPLIYGDFADRTLRINANFTATAVAMPSDARLKKSIKPLGSCLEKVSNLEGISYEWDTEAYPDSGFMPGKQIGLVAQDVEKVLPELVSEDKDGYKSVSYTKLTAVLVEAVKELKAENERQKELLEKQQVEIEELRSMMKGSKT